MTFTFSDTSITTDLAKVRTLIGDTKSTDPLLTDEQINFFLGVHPDIYEAAADSVEAILGDLARDVDRSNLGMQSTRSQKTQHYQDLLSRLRSGNHLAGRVAFGGQSRADKDTIASDSDYPTPAIGRSDNDITTNLPGSKCR